MDSDWEPVLALVDVLGIFTPKNDPRSSKTHIGDVHWLPKISEYALE